MTTLATLARLDGWNLNFLVLGSDNGKEPQLRFSIPVGHHLDEEALLRDYARKEVEKYLRWRLQAWEATFRNVPADIERVPLTRFKSPRKRRSRNPAE